tara:strand:- start:6820 stop:7176 length:357 start_codon:yes stop_codon:yes gene_type:complete
MSEKKAIKPVALAVGAALAGSFAISGSVNAEGIDNPFEMSTLSVGYMLGEGEGSCGGDTDKEGEGSCGEGSCGGDDEGEGEDKEGEGSCGEGSCGADGEGEDKEGEGSCGEGSCGGSV